jgi:hypothetical protein
MTAKAREPKLKVVPVVGGKIGRERQKIVVILGNMDLIAISNLFGLEVVSLAVPAKRFIFVHT